MLYVHSFSSIEQALAMRLMKSIDLTQLDIIQLRGEHLKRYVAFEKSKTLLYSFQLFNDYSRHGSFQDEEKKVGELIQFIQSNGFEKVILISHSGANHNSHNLFLKHKGKIEQLFMQSGIPCTILITQGIGDMFLKLNNFHELFYDLNENAYIIPLKNEICVYSVTLDHLICILKICLQENKPGKYDLFDTLLDLRVFLQIFSRVGKTERIAPIYLYFKNLIGNYPLPTMIELFTSHAIPMFKFRTEKEFSIFLEPIRIFGKGESENHTRTEVYIETQVFNQLIVVE